MEDIIQKYKKWKKIKNSLLVITSFLLALGLSFSFSSTDFWKSIKWSVLQNWSITNQTKWDLYLEKLDNKVENILNIKANQTIKNAKSLSFSLVYDETNLKMINKINLIENTQIIDLKNEKWVNTVIINFKKPTSIEKWQTLLNVVFEKKEDKTNIINLISSNFTDSNNNMYSLTTSWINF